MHRYSCLLVALVACSSAPDTGPSPPPPPPPAPVDAPATTSPEAPTGTQASELKLRRTLGVVLFDGFEALDVFGPIEMFSYVGPTLKIVTVAEKSMVKSFQGNLITVDATYGDAPDFDLLMVPGGMGNVPDMVIDPRTLDFIKARADAAELVLSVCTGSAVLARAGVLDGYRATSNKLFFNLARAAGVGHDVTWIPKARWVVDRNRWTSSGVSAGTDMALAVIQELWGETMAKTIATSTEWIWHKDPNDDPFAL